LPKFPFIPQGRKFFDLLEAASTNAVKTARALNDLVMTWQDVEVKVNHIDDLEHAGDSITHQIMELLNRTFVTPFDREDIASLAHSLDDVTDFIHAAAISMFIYKVDGPNPRATELTDIIVRAAVGVERGVFLLRQHGRLRQVLEHCVEINRLENMADDVYRPAMAELFENSPDMASVIKWREIYEHLESATDRCEDVANVLEGITLKHA
jgi:predicted phosphate transport protein (TIGR00153 family)